MKILNLLQNLANEQKHLNTDNLNEFHYILHEGFSILLRLLAPITPHITHTLWQLWRFDGIIINAKFPKAVASALKNDSVELVVQINGKLRGQITVKAEADEETIKTIALQHTALQSYIANKAVKKIIIVPKKLINIVV